jgi:hypothetical protein
MFNRRQMDIPDLLNDRVLIGFIREPIEELEQEKQRIRSRKSE